MRIPSSLLPHTVYISDNLGSTAYGPKFAAPNEYRARVEFTNGITQNAEGEDVRYSARLFLLPEVNVSPGARVEYRDPRGRSYTLTLITAAPMSDPQGNISHIEAEASLG